MERDPNAMLYDIAASCRRIISFTSAADFQRYTSDELLKSAVERQFIIIGEALNRLGQLRSEIVDRISDSSQIIGFRNILVHGYDVVTDYLVWEIISENVPELLAQCEAILVEKE